MALTDVLVHRATPLITSQGTPDPSEWIEGDYGEAEHVPGAPFSCVLFLPQGRTTSEGRGRQVLEPTLLYANNDDGTPIGLPHEAELDVVAPELNVAEGRSAEAAVRWVLVGSPQPFGRPGDDVIGYQATVRRVDDA